MEHCIEDLVRRIEDLERRLEKIDPVTITNEHIVCLFFCAQTAFWS